MLHIPTNCIECNEPLTTVLNLPSNNINVTQLTCKSNEFPLIFEAYNDLVFARTVIREDNTFEFSNISQPKYITIRSVCFSNAEDHKYSRYLNLECTSSKLRVDYENEEIYGVEYTLCTSSTDNVVYVKPIHGDDDTWSTLPKAELRTFMPMKRIPHLLLLG